MKAVVYTQSDSFREFMSQQVAITCRFCAELSAPDTAADLHLVHATSYSSPEIERFVAGRDQLLAVVEDAPSAESMLAYTKLGVKGYGNSYMADAHYQQLLQMLVAGSSWYPPALLGEVFSLAEQRLSATAANSGSHKGGQDLSALTLREHQVAFAVAEGKSNKEVARECGITERTVKAHLTNIFEKLQLKDRVALVIYIQNQQVVEVGR